MNFKKRILPFILSSAICLTSVLVSVSAKEIGSDTFDENNIVLNYGSVSDIHYGTAANTNDDKLAKAIKTFQKASGGADKLDAVTVSGDLTNYGLNDEYIPIKNILESTLTPNTEFIATPGNHDDSGKAFIDYNPIKDVLGKWSYFKPIEGNTEADIIRGNYHTVVKGIHFISVKCVMYTMESSDIKWLDAQIKSAQKSDPTKPIVVLAHIHPYHTCYGSYQVGDSNKGWQSEALRKVLEKYPQVVSYTGHTHFPVTDDSSIWQDTFTSINASSMRYMSIEENYVENGSSQEGIDGNENISSCIFTQVDKNGVVKVTRYNLNNNEILGQQIKKPWVFKTMQKSDDAVYTVANRAKLQHPYFPSDRKFKVSGNVIFNAASFKVNFSSALAPDDMVQHYEVEIRDKATQESISIIKSYTKFFLYNDPEIDMPKEEKNLTISASDLKSNTDYQLCVFALDSFGNKSEPLIYEFKSDTYSAAPIFDFGYKPLINFQNWDLDTSLGNNIDVNDGIVYDSTLKGNLEITTTNNNIFKDNSLKLTSKKANVARDFSIDLGVKNPILTTDANDPSFISFFVDSTEFKSPNTGVIFSFTDGKDKFILKDKSPLMFFTKDGYTNSTVTKNSYNSPEIFVLEKGFHGRIIIPISSFSSDSGADPFAAIKNIKLINIALTSTGFSRSNIYLDEFGLLVPKDEPGASQPPLLEGEAPAKEIKLGDVNDDGVISTLDALCILKHLAKLEFLEGDQLIAADYDPNTIIDTIDVIKILKKLANLE